MSEFLFVIKCFFSTILLIMIMQVRVGGQSIETKTDWFVRKSSISLYLQSVAAGGAYAVRNFATSVKDSISGAAENYQKGSNEQKAVR